MTTNEQRPWRATAKAVEGEPHNPDSTTSGPADIDPVEAAGCSLGAAALPLGPVTLAEALQALAAELPALRAALNRQAGPPIDRMTLRLDELADALGVSRRAIERERSAGRFPRPDLTIGKMPLWRVETVRAWLEKGGCAR